MPRFKSLPYRPCVGMAVFNREGRVFIGRRIDGPEHVDDTHAWQLPQGGIDRGEDPWPAALRELYEETNIRSVEKLGEIEEELCYDIPRELVAERIIRYVRLLGRENVLAGTDCGFAQGPFYRRVHPSIMWAKLEALAEGARLATRELWT